MINVGGVHRAGDARTQRGRQLGDEGADTAGASVHQHALARLNFCVVDQGFPCG